MNKFNERSKGPAQALSWGQPLQKLSIVLTAIVIASFGQLDVSEAGSPTFTTIDFPGSAATLVNGMAPAGPVVVVGDYVDSMTGTERSRIDANKMKRRI